MNETTAQTELAVVIGRFQPFHLGHLALLEKALALAPRALLVVGSSPGPRMAKNPFSAEERIESIRQSLTPEQQARVGFAPVRDYYDEPRWAGAVKAAVARETTGRVTLVGFRKDDSSAYLSLFPEWREHALPRQAPIDGTALRRQYFESATAELPAELARAVPAAVARFLAEFRSSPHFEPLRDELRALAHSRQTYGAGPFVTVDALVTAADQILLVQRGRAPGKGLWALPGGFLEGSERLLSGAIRELQEETRIACTAAELRAAFRRATVFDHPQRSQRGRTITHAHHFALTEAAPRWGWGPTDKPGTRPVEGADDAQAARWFPLSQLPTMLDRLFEDHFQIIDHFFSLSRD
jgi:bifunctional NMN adenylyltransferase/nudix hydrolase